MPIATRPLRYRDGPVELTGYVAVDEQPGNPRPGLLLVHGGGGLDENARHQARRYAALGYPVLACDMFGEIPADREQVMTRIRAMREDPDAMVSRAMAGVRELRGLSEVDGRVAAVGFCFGGTTVLTLARAGADLAGVISMHGGLSTSRPAQPGAVHSKVLVCHGADDPHVPTDDVVRFMTEMTNAGADWQLIAYGGAVHGFTHSTGGPASVPGVAYHEPTDRRSFQAATAFLAELFSERAG